jgi:branched-chain amino acid transport system permease protein
VQNLAQPIVNGILLGGLYALIGLGMSIVFGIMKLTNLAHGDFLILASYISLAVIGFLGINPLVSIIFVVPVMFYIGYLAQVHLLSRVSDRGAEPPLIITFGLSIIIQNALLTVYKPDAQTLRTALAAQSIQITPDLFIPVMYLISFIIGVVVILVLSAFFQYSYPGRAIRAASDNGAAAKLMGINIRKTYGNTMGIALATAGVAGVLIGMSFNFYPYTGTQYLIIAFGVVVIGGLGSMVGTLIAGIILGLAQVLGGHFFGTSSQLLAGYLVLLLMLAFKPTGLFAKK